MTRTRKHNLLYVSNWHIIATFTTIAIPLVFLLSFSVLTHVAILDLLRNIAISSLRLLIAYIIAALLGWLCAVLFYKGKRSYIALPFFDVLQSFPTYAALPIAVLYWGANEFVVIFFLMLAIIWPIFFSIISSLKLIRHDWDEVATIYRLKGFHYFIKYIGPISLPGLITGSIIGLGDGWEALVATEIIIGLKSGLGHFFNTFSTNTTVTTFGILGLLLFIFMINRIIWLPLLEFSHNRMEE